MGKRDGARQWRQWTEQQARAALAELAASGESAAGFARRKGVSSQRLAYWRGRLARPASTEFVAVELAGDSLARWMEIVVGGVVVRVREELDAERVAQLVRALGRQVGGAC